MLPVRLYIRHKFAKINLIDLACNPKEGEKRGDRFRATHSRDDCVSENVLQQPEKKRNGRKKQRGTR